MIKKLISVFLCIFIVCSLFTAVSAEETKGSGQIKNIIYMIPDGGGMEPLRLAEATKRAGGYDNKEIYIFTHPVGDRQFNLAAVCPAQDIYGKYSSMYNILLFWGISGVLLLIYILYIVIGRHLRPLHLLADAAQGIAEGNLDTLIPDSHTEHEAGRLQTSLKKMQQSLQAYIKEMQLQQDKLNAQNAKLQAAYSEAQAYEKKKAKFCTK